MESRVVLETADGRLNRNPFSHKLEISDQYLTVFNLKVLSSVGEFSIRSGNLYYLQPGGKVGLSEIPWKFYHASEGVSLVDPYGNTFEVDGRQVFRIRKYNLSMRLGIVHWGGKYQHSSEDALYEGARLAKDMQLDKFKMYIGRKSDSHYFTQYNNTSPADIIRQENYQRVLGMGFKLIVIVCHAKSTSSWKKAKICPSFKTEQEELRKLALELGKFKETEFIITNWEGDCIIAEDKTSDVYDRMTKWVTARQRGIDKAAQPNVKHAIEVNFVRQSCLGHKSVLTEVVPHVRTDFISYSCYDCDNSVQFNEAVELILKISNRPLIIGEFGSPVNKTSSENSLRYISAILNISEQKNIKACFYWQLYENEFVENAIGEDQPLGFGIIGPDARVNGIWALLSFFD